ncbi:MAG: 6-phosphogluconolactonase, partial [Terriglobales bacterium]
MAEPAWAEAAARIVLVELAARPAALVGLPTGVTPLPLYAELRRLRRTGALAAPALRVMMIDDYLDSRQLPTNSYHWLQRKVIGPLDIPDERVLRMPVDSLQIEAACAHFEQDLAAQGGCDLLFLGLGANGHVAFNEPGTSPQSRTRVVPL